jgi:hypothetical protein
LTNQKGIHGFWESRVPELFAEDYDYLVGYDHLGCVLKQEEITKDTLDKCVICGKESPYLHSTHVDLRVGYVDGGGQGCFQPIECDK